MDCKDALQNKIDSIVSKIKGQNELSEIKKTVATAKVNAIGALNTNTLTDQIDSMNESVSDTISQIDDITETADTCLDLLTGGCADSAITEISGIAKRTKNSVNTMIRSVTGAIDSTISQVLDSVMVYINDVSSVKKNITDLDNYLNCSADIADSEYIEYIQSVSDEVDGYLENMGLDDSGETDFDKTMEKITEDTVGISNSVKNTVSSGVKTSRNLIDGKVTEQTEEAKSYLSDLKSSVSTPKNYF